MPIARLEHVEVGTRVAYEDMANPRREGRIAEILEHGDQRTPSGLPLPGGTEYRVRWDEPRDGGERETVTDLRQHGWTMLADMPGSIFDGADVISIYTRTDAIRDGVLVPVSDLVPDEPRFARDAGWTVPVALTRAVAELVTPTEREADEYLQDVKGRLWDVLMMAMLYTRRSGARGDTVLFPCVFRLAGPERERWTPRAASKTLDLKCSIGPDDDGEPVVTIMLRGED